VARQSTGKTDQTPKTRGGKPNVMGRKSRLVPPLRAAARPKNSHTSPKKVQLEKNKARALQLRERGFTYQQISQVMKRPANAIHDWSLTRSTTW
jgi:hypothetical protein